MMNLRWIGLGLVSFSSLVAAETPEDPWESVNRSIFSFNETFDKYALKPLAEGYDAVTPEPVQTGVSNFFLNLDEIPNTFNNLLQGKWDETASSTSRFLVNSTIGVYGLFDVASAMGMQRYKEDFGQTLGYWGVDSGPYVMLPFLGPSTVRDAGGLVVDYSLYSGLDLIDASDDEKLIALAIDGVQTRAKYLSTERMIFGDRYSFLRDVYIQNRAGEVKDNQNTTNNAASEAGTSSWSEGESDSWGDEDSWGDQSSWEGEDSWGQ